MNDLKVNTTFFDETEIYCTSEHIERLLHVVSDILLYSREKTRSLNDAATTNGQVCNNVVENNATKIGGIETTHNGCNGIVDQSNQCLTIVADPFDQSQGIVIKNTEKDINGQKNELVVSNVPTGNGKSSEKQGIDTSIRDNTKINTSSRHVLHKTSSNSTNDLTQLEPPTKKIKKIDEPKASPKNRCANIRPVIPFSKRMPSESSDDGEMGQPSTLKDQINTNVEAAAAASTFSIPAAVPVAVDVTTSTKKSTVSTNAPTDKPKEPPVSSNNDRPSTSNKQSSKRKHENIKNVSTISQVEKYKPKLDPSIYVLTKRIKSLPEPVSSLEETIKNNFHHLFKMYGFRVSNMDCFVSFNKCTPDSIKKVISNALLTLDESDQLANKSNKALLKSLEGYITNVWSLYYWTYSIAIQYAKDRLVMLSPDKMCKTNHFAQCTIFHQKLKLAIEWERNIRTNTISRLVIAVLLQLFQPYKDDTPCARCLKDLKKSAQTQSCVHKNITFNSGAMVDVAAFFLLQILCHKNSTDTCPSHETSSKDLRLNAEFLLSDITHKANKPELTHLKQFLSRVENSQIKNFSGYVYATFPRKVEDIPKNDSDDNGDRFSKRIIEVSTAHHVICTMSGLQDMQIAAMDYWTQKHDEIVQERNSFFVNNSESRTKNREKNDDKIEIKLIPELDAPWREDLRSMENDEKYNELYFSELLARMNLAPTSLTFFFDEVIFELDTSLPKPMNTSLDVAASQTQNDISSCGLSKNEWSLYYFIRKHIKLSEYTPDRGNEMAKIIAPDILRIRKYVGEFDISCSAQILNNVCAQVVAYRNKILKEVPDMLQCL